MSCARAHSTSRRSIACVLAPKAAFEKLNRPRFQALKPPASEQSLREERRALLRAQRREPVAARIALATSPNESTPSAANALRARKAAAKASCERCFEARLLARLGAVGLDHANARERLLDLRGERAVARRAPRGSRGAGAA